MSGLTDVPGVRVGHATDREAATGCTVVLGPFRAACDVRGLATGTRELETLDPLHIAPRADAILLTGGSAFGLEAATGVVQWLEERGAGFDAGVARVPIVPAAVIFDLGVGKANRRPDAAMGRAACEAATDGPIEEGRVGAGTGATVGKGRGIEWGMARAVEACWVQRPGGTTGPLAVVTAVRAALAAARRLAAGARGEDAGFTDTAEMIRAGGREGDRVGAVLGTRPGQA